MPQLPPISGFTSISAAASNGVGASTPAPPQFPYYSIQCVVSGGSATIVLLEGTLNGTNWFKLATWTLGTQSSGDIVTSSPCVVSAVRANYSSGSGTVTAYISGVGVANE